jgi:hypothetical protein
MPVPARQLRALGRSSSRRWRPTSDGDPAAVRARVTYLLGVTDEAS